MTLTAQRPTPFAAVLAVVVLSAVRGTAADATPAASERPIRYSRDIRPILSQNCFLCHGKDETRRLGGVRLDEREFALVESESGLLPIVPGKPEESELIARITATDETMMPPPDSHKTLTPEQIDLLTRWVAEGAEYESHWSFIPLERPAVPAIGDAASANPIDAFIQERLQRETLKPAPKADRRTLIRRATLDLTGLPPSPAEIAEFLADDRADAYERLVDRLLASPRYGERMAMDWMDVARYADTHGYHIDSQRDMWAWRDWVIKAFNSNMPFDDFTVWQIAGDLLPDATQEQKLASGFNRNHPINFEGGAIPEEYHVEYVVDRVSTTGTVWMGLTLGCARCHDHKYDPISQKEFFEMFAFFNNVDEAGLDGHRGNAKPMLSLPSEEQQKSISALTEAIKALELKLAGFDQARDEAQAAWEPQAKDPANAAIRPGDWSQWGAVPVDTPEIGLATTFEIASPVKLDAKYRNVDGLHGWYPAPQLIDGTVAEYGGDSSVVHLVRKIESDDARTVRFNVGTTDAIQVWLNGKLIFERRDQQAFSPFQHELELPLNAGSNELLVKLVNYGWEWKYQGGFEPKSSVAPAPNVTALLAIDAGKRTKEQQESLRAYFTACHFEDGDYQAAAHELASRRAELDRVQSEVPSSMVMQELAERRKTYRLDRGQYTNPVEEVTPAVPAALPPLPEKAAANRLGLAQWLVEPNHPLTARVTVNRLWQALLGVGLVKTSEDFGLQGAFPAHPDLLDWLAVEFIDSGWDVKHMMRLMLTSHAYQQASATAADAYQRDPENQLMARGSRFRMPAEFIRDQALAAGGLLDPRIGGPSVKPYQPGDLWGELAHQKHNYKFTAQLFEQDHGADLYRRTMYTFWKRSVPPPNLNALDAPSREVCTVRRERTNTPLQALVLLNDPTFVEAARKLAERTMRSTGDQRERIAQAFELVTARKPDEREAAILLAELEKQQASFAADPPAARELLSVGESPRDEALDAVEHAAWTNVAIVLLNLDEAVTRN